ncbi:MAG TPA: hypothetical protein VI653_01350 [Steroidobacteraceae bacterium]
MIRKQGTIQEVSIRIVCVAATAAALYGCSRAEQSPATGNAALAAPAQNTEMAEVVITTSRPQRPKG